MTEFYIYLRVSHNYKYIKYKLNYFDTYIINI